MKRQDQPQRNAKSAKSIFRSSSLSSLCSFAAIICLPVSLWAQTKTDISHSVRLMERKVDTGVPGQPEIQLILRLPDGHTPDGPTAKGVLAFCTWQGETDSLRKRLASNEDELVKYAKKHQLALLTWNTATLWQTGKSYDQIKRSQLQGQDQDFDKVARAWKTGVGKLCKEFNLPQDGYLLYGISRGELGVSVHKRIHFVSFFTLGRSRQKGQKGQSYNIHIGTLCPAVRGRGVSHFILIIPDVLVADPSARTLPTEWIDSTT